MIRVVISAPDGGLTCGGRELLEAPVPAGGSVWVDLQGFDSAHEKLLVGWGFHPLAIEDTFTLHHQPKVEEYTGHLFVIVRGLNFNPKQGNDDTLGTLKLAAFLTPLRLVTVHRAPLRSVETVRRRDEETGRALPGGAAQVLWSICDERMAEEVMNQLSRTFGQSLEVVEKTGGEGLAFMVASEKQGDPPRYVSKEENETLRQKLLDIAQTVVYRIFSKGGVK